MWVEDILIEIGVVGILGCRAQSQVSASADGLRSYKMRGQLGPRRRGRTGW